MAPAGGGFRAPERSGLFGREHRSAENRLRMAGAGEFLPSLEALPIGRAVMGSASLPPSYPVTNPVIAPTETPGKMLAMAEAESPRCGCMMPMAMERMSTVGARSRPW